MDYIFLDLKQYNQPLIFLFHLFVEILIFVLQYLLYIFYEPGRLKVWPKVAQLISTV